MKTITVLGGGSWGATVASHLAKNGHAVSIWEFAQSQVDYMNKNRSLQFLPQLHIPQSVKITSDIAQALQGTQVIFSIVPSQHVRQTWHNASAQKIDWDNVELVISLSKGIESESLKTMTDIIAQECPKLSQKLCAVSGPSHAEEVAKSVPTAVVAASAQQHLAQTAQTILGTPYFRVYTHSDILAVELCGALKNIFAIATGACDGIGLGDNTKAALMTRALHEMTKLGQAMGTSKDTFYGLAGMGDLIVTCLSAHSRNRLLGEKIGQGKSAQQALSEMTMVAEGYPTSKSAWQLIQKYKVDCPIIAEIYKVLYENKNIKESMQDLLQRPTGEEYTGLTWTKP